MLRCLIIKPITPLLRNATVQNGGISVGFSLIFTTRRAVQGVAVLLPVTMPQPLPTMKVWQAAARRPESSTDLLAMRGCRPKHILPPLKIIGLLPTMYRVTNTRQMLGGQQLP